MPFSETSFFGGEPSARELRGEYRELSGAGTVRFPLVRLVTAARRPVLLAVFLLWVAVIAAKILGVSSGRVGAVIGEDTSILGLITTGLLGLALYLHRPLHKAGPFPFSLATLALGLASLGIAASLGWARAEGLSAYIETLGGGLVGATTSLRFNAALAYGLVALFLILRNRFVSLAIFVMLWPPMILLLALVGRLYGIGDFEGAMDLSTIVMLGGLSFASFALVSHHRMFRIVLGRSTTGVIARTQIIIGALVPLVMGMVLLGLKQVNSAELDTLLVTSMICFFGAAILISMRIVDRYDWQRRMLERRLVSLSFTDQLTGAQSRRSALLQIPRILAKARRDEEPLGVVMIDLDHFKRVNDTLGHEAGDFVLVRVAYALKAELRASDILARWGGEEFLVILPGACLTDTAGIAEALRARIQRDLAFDLPPEWTQNSIGDVSVTASIGFTTWLPEEDDLGPALSRADLALYRAKNGGRNRIRGAIPQGLQGAAQIPGGADLGEVFGREQAS